MNTEKGKATIIVVTAWTIRIIGGKRLIFPMQRGLH